MDKFVLGQPAVKGNSDVIVTYKIAQGNDGEAATWTTDQVEGRIVRMAIRSPFTVVPAYDRNYTPIGFVVADGLYKDSGMKYVNVCIAGAFVPVIYGSGGNNVRSGLQRVLIHDRGNASIVHVSNGTTNDILGLSIASGSTVIAVNSEGVEHEAILVHFMGMGYRVPW